MLDGKHPDLHHVLLKLRQKPAEPVSDMPHILNGGVGGKAAAQLLRDLCEPGLLDNQLSYQVHQVFQPLHVNPDGGIRCPRSPPSLIRFIGGRGR
ncbi:hypothetical protein D3C73_1522960 [compost metagenome]